MLTSPLSHNHGSQHEKQKRRGDSKSSKAGLNSEVILILGEPTPGDLSAILQWGVNPTRRCHQRRLLIFASDIQDLPQSALQTQSVDIHILSNRLGEISGSDSDETPGEAIHLLGVLESASQFAATWRARTDRCTHDGRLTNGDPQFSSRHDSAHSDCTRAIDSPRINHSTRTTPAALSDVNDDIHTKLRSPQDYRYDQSNSNSKFTASRRTVPASKGLLSNFLSFSLPSVPRPSSPSICNPQSTTHSGFRGQSHNQHFILETYARTFDTILNFLPPDQTEKSLLKQVILLSTLCGQYFARSKPEILSLSQSRAFDSPTSRRPFSSSGEMYSRNIFSRNSTTESKAGEARRTSTASSGSSASGSASPARSSTPSQTSRSTTPSDTQKRRSSMLSWLSTTSASQASDPEPGVDTKLDIRPNFNNDGSQGKSIELRRRLSFLFGRMPKRSELALNPLPQVVTVAPSEEKYYKIKRRRTKFEWQISHKAYLIHILPTSLSVWPAGTPSHAFHDQRIKNEILDEPELLEKRRNSLPSPLPLFGALHGSAETATRSFTHARMQSSLMRRATLEQMRLHNLERRYSVPAAFVERDASRTILNPVSRGGLFTRHPVQFRKREKPPLVDQLENFLGDYFGQGNIDVLPFVLDGGVFGRGVDQKMGKSGSKKRVLVGEAILSGLLDEFAMNRQCWIGDEELRDLVNHLKAGKDEETEESVEKVTVKCPPMGPKHPPPAAISPSSSEGSEGAGPAGIPSSPSSQRSRSRALSDIGPSVTSKHNVIPLPRAAMNALKAPEPAHIYPPSRPLASQSLTTPTYEITPIPATNGSFVPKLTKRLAKE